jgi:hypothetical protein
MVPADSHISKSQRSRSRERNEPHKIREHSQSNALRSDVRRPDLRTPNEGGCVDELEQHDKHEDEDYCSSIASFVCGANVLALKKSYDQEICC